jgi:hypothetical protein
MPIPSAPRGRTGTSWHLPTGLRGRAGRAFALVPHHSPLGSAQFLAVVGITADELERMKRTTTAEVLSELAEHSPLLITDPTR